VLNYTVGCAILHRWMCFITPFWGYGGFPCYGLLVWNTTQVYSSFKDFDATPVLRRYSGSSLLHRRYGANPAQLWFYGVTPVLRCYGVIPV